jgi:catalase
MEPIDMKPSPALSIVGKMKPTLAGRKVGILFDEGSNKADIDRVKADVEAAGGKAMLIAPKVGGIKVRGGTLKADGQLAGTPSILFDAVALVLTPRRPPGFRRAPQSISCAMPIVI